MATSFTPLASFAGGLLIGLAALLLMTGLGRIMGGTGILGGFLLPESRREWLWRALFLTGALAGPWVFALFSGQLPVIQTPVPSLMILIGGLIVGIGTTLGSGCTSGHGVCGLARFSKRSLVATLTFMGSALVTVYLLRHVLGVQA